MEERSGLRYKTQGGSRNDLLDAWWQRRSSEEESEKVVVGAFAEAILT
jgi:hypothetical protein